MKWPKLPFLKAVTDVTGGNKKIQKKALLPEGVLPVVDQGQDLIAGYTNEEAQFKGKIPIVLFGDHTRIFKYVDFSFALGADGVKALQTSEFLSPQFFYYYCQTLNIPSKGYSRHFKLLKQKHVPLPPLSEQRRIVEILDQAHRLRNLRAEADKKAERILPALFIKMFGDPATNPMEWETFELNSKKLLSIKGGGTPSKKNLAYWNGSIPWVSPKDMKSEIIKDTEDHVTEKAIQKSSTNIVPTKSILIVVRSGILAHTVPIALAGCDVALNQDMKSFTVKDENELNTLFLLGWMKSTTSSLIRSCIKFGATVHSIDMSRLGSLKVIKPPIEDQNKFALQFQQDFSLQGKRKRSFEIIDQLFNIMLHRAFTGDLTASWRQAHMKELLQEMKIQAKALAP